MKTWRIYFPGSTNDISESVSQNEIVRRGAAKPQQKTTRTDWLRVRLGLGLGLG